MALALILAVLVGGGVITLVVLLVMYTHRKLEERRAVWRQVAVARGGRHILPSGFWRRQNERIELRLGDVPLVVDTYSTGGKNQVHYTRVRAVVRGIPGCRFKVYREGVFSSLGKALGTQDVVLGSDRGFDDHFMVKADEPALVRRVFEAPAMRAMHAGFPAATLSCDGREIALVEVGVWDNAARIEAGIDLVGALATRDVYNATALAALGGADFRWTDRGTPQVAIAAPARVEFEPEVAGGELIMVARLAEAPETSPMTLSIAGGRPTDPEQASKLPQGAQARMSGVGTGTLVIDGDEARFQWAAIDLDSATLRAGGELLAALTGGAAAGVYR